MNNWNINNSVITSKLNSFPPALLQAGHAVQENLLLPVVVEMHDVGFSILEEHEPPRDPHASSVQDTNVRVPSFAHSCLYETPLLIK
jgi:hypothetical protein